MPEAATLTHGGFRYGARTGTPPTYRISLQSLDASGLPDSGAVLASQTFTPPADTSWDGTWQWVQFSATYAAAAGERVALVVDYSSGTVDGSNNSSFTRRDTGIAPARAGLPFNVTDTTGSWAKATDAGFPVWGVKSAGATYGFPLKTFTGTTVSSTGNRAAKKFTIPSGVCSTFTIVGLRLIAQGPATGANTWNLAIWNAAGTELAGVSIDGDVISSPANAQRSVVVYFDDSPVTFNAGTAYYAGIERAGSNIILYSLTLDSAAERTAFPLGTNCSLSTWNGSAWSDDDTSLPLVELILGDMTASGGSGGFIIGA